MEVCRFYTGCTEASAKFTSDTPLEGVRKDSMIIQLASYRPRVALSFLRQFIRRDEPLPDETTYLACVGCPLRYYADRLPRTGEPIDLDLDVWSEIL